MSEKQDQTVSPDADKVEDQSSEGKATTQKAPKVTAAGPGPHDSKVTTEDLAEMPEDRSLYSEEAQKAQDDAAENERIMNEAPRSQQ